MWAKRNDSGFTIVELLIVIVVIAILAAITVVAYNGIQDRSRNAQVTSGASQYNKAFESYRAVYDRYPIYAGCLGANYPSNICWTNSGSPDRSVNANLDSQLSEFVPAKPTLATALLDMDSTLRRSGMVYYIGGSYSELRYYLQGLNQACIGGFTQANEGLLTRCLRVLTT